MDVGDRFLVRLSAELERTLSEEAVDLAQEIRKHLRNHGLDVLRDRSTFELETNGSRQKDPALVLAAVGLTSAALGWAVAQVLDAIGRNKKVVVTESAMKAVLDGNGRPVLSAHGSPVLYVAEETRMIETGLAPRTSKLTGEANLHEVRIALESSG